MRLDRRNPVFARRRGVPPKSGADFPDWLFPETTCSKLASRRPKSIEDVFDNMDEAEQTNEGRAKRRRLNEVWRYDVDHGGALGVGMGMAEDEDRILIDDLHPK